MKTEKDNSNYLIQGFQPGVLNIITDRLSQGKSNLAMQSAINTVIQNEMLHEVKHGELRTIVAASGIGKSRLLNTGRAERISTKDIKPQFIIFDTITEIDKLMKEKYTKFRQMDIKSIRYNFKGGK